MAVLESLFKQIHVQPDEGAFALRHLKKDVNVNLEQSGERYALQWREIVFRGSMLCKPHDTIWLPEQKIACS